MKEQNCVAAATFKCDCFTWKDGTFKAKPNCKVAIKRPGEKHAWKYNLSVESADYKRLKIWPGSRLPEDINEDVWQIDLVTDTTQIDLVTDTQSNGI